jgi:hypothetical protein
MNKIIIELREMMFDDVRNGIKVATLRKGKRDYPLGNTVLIGDKGRNCVLIDVKSLEEKTIADVTDNDAKVEGYANRQELIDVMSDIYGDVKESTVVTQVHFDFIGTPNYGYFLNMINGEDKK